MIKTIYFDFFKVICDPIYTPVILKYLSGETAKQFINKLDVLDIGDMTEKDFVEEIAKTSGIETSLIQKDADNFAKLNMELLSFIKNELKSKYKIGLLTNAHESLIHRIFGEYLSLFDIVLISSKLHIIKPNKEIFKIAIKEADVSPEEILFIDDSKRNIEAAQTLGIQTILFTDNGSLKTNLLLTNLL